MLRLWPDFSSQKMWVALGIDGIAIVQQARGLQKRVISQQFIQAQDSQEQSVNSAAWQPLIHQLDNYLNSIESKKNMQLNVVLSSDFVRYAILPAQQIAISNTEKNAYAQALFSEIYGAAAHGWQVKYHAAAPNKSTLAVAVDQLLLAAINQLAGKYQLKLDSVQPYLMAACNALVPQLSRATAHIVLPENSKLLVLQVQKGVCQQIKVTPYNQDWQAVLHDLLKRESLLNEHLEASDKSLLVYAPAQKNIPLNMFNGWKTQGIQPKARTALAPPFYMLETVL